MNPLLEIQFRVPFDQIESSHVEPAVDELLIDANLRVQAAVADPNPLVAIDTMTERLDFALSVVRGESLLSIATLLLSGHSSLSGGGPLSLVTLKTKRNSCWLST